MRLAGRRDGRALTALAGLALAAAGCASLDAPAAGGAARAELRSPAGQVVGAATFTQVGSGVRVLVEVWDLPPGVKGVHVHEVGRCQAPGFTSAGGHFNPRGRQHGALNPAGPHAGDLPNLTVGPDGRGRLETTSELITLGSGSTSVLDSDGSALVVHGAPDDFRTDPTGNSGARIACGVLVRP